MIRVSHNLPEFQAAMTQYMRLIPRELASALNWKGLIIVKNAQKGTPLASRGDIEKAMGVAGYEVKAVTRGKNKGQMRQTTRAVWGQWPRAFSIVLGRLKKQGAIGPQNRDTLAQRAQKLVMAKIRAIGSTKAGWNMAIRQLSAAVKKQEFNPSFGRGGKRKLAMPGYGKPANPRSWKPAAEVSYDMLAKTKHTNASQARTYDKVEDAAAKAIRQEAKSTLEYIARKQSKLASLFIPGYHRHRY